MGTMPGTALEQALSTRPSVSRHTSESPLRIGVIDGERTIILIGEPC